MLGQTWHGSVHADTLEITHSCSLSVIPPPRSDAVSIWARPGHCSSQFPGPAEQALEALPSVRDAVGTFGSCTASPVHSSHSPHCQQELHDAVAVETSLGAKWCLRDAPPVGLVPVGLGCYGVPSVSELSDTRLGYVDLRNIFPKQWKQGRRRSQMSP